jgi:hypothetical protein
MCYLKVLTYLSLSGYYRGSAVHVLKPLKTEFATEHVKGARGSVVVKTLCYKPEGREFETR